MDGKLELFSVPYRDLINRPNILIVGSFSGMGLIVFLNCLVVAYLSGIA